jgi:hypothetical protein
MWDEAMTEVEVEAWWSSRPRKRRVRHGCGSPLLVEVLAILEEAVVVSFRSAVRGASDLPVYHCPGCGRVLKLWWTADEWVGWWGGAACGGQASLGA